MKRSASRRRCIRCHFIHFDTGSFTMDLLIDFGYTIASVLYAAFFVDGS